MSETTSGLELSQQSINKPPKTKQEYSRNVKKLKLKLKNIEQAIIEYEKKLSILTSTSNDKMIALKISKFCRERKMTPEMLYRFADKDNKKSITKEKFSETLKSIGLSLNHLILGFQQNQLKRLEYLIDEDLSGEISWQEYNSFLYAFGVKAEYSANDQFLKDALKKFDIDKILGLSEQQSKKKKGENAHRQLLNYQQFMKYCHRHFPAMKNKEIAVIFNRLQKNGMIDLQDFLDYIKRKQEQDRKLNQKNQKRPKKKDGEEEQQDESKTLKGIIKALLKYRPKDGKLLFHSSQFQRLEKILQKPKGELVALFRQIDKMKKGSFTFNELIQYYVANTKKNMLYVYELMGRKSFLSNQKPEDTLRQYNKNIHGVTQNQFIKYCESEYELTKNDAVTIFTALANKQKQVPVRTIIDAMKLEEGQKKIVYIKPTLWNTTMKDYFRKTSQTIYFNPFVALRGCISIMDELNKVKQLLWDDFEFGPTFEDPSGIYSIGMNIEEQNVKWISTNSLQMNEFYIPTSGQPYKSSAFCSHGMFPKALATLLEQSQSFLWSQKKLDKNTKKVQEKDLVPLFEGLYPLIFHPFAKYGIYVFRFFVKEKWVYVLIDNKIPCNSENQPLFSTSSSKKLSWVSLVEKAYAKVKGNYQRIFQPATSKHYIYELSRIMPVQIDIQHEFKSQDEKNALWNKLKKTIPKNSTFSLTTDEGISRLVQNNVETGLLKNSPYQIESLLQIDDKYCQNSHKSHRLAVFEGLTLKNEHIWNNWSHGEQNNKFDKFEKQIDEKLKQQKSKVSIHKEKDFAILNFKLFRTVFNKISYFMRAHFETTIVLRKIVQFEKKYPCKYEISGLPSKEKNKDKIQFIVCLNRVKSPLDTVLKLKLTNEKQSVISEKDAKNMFICEEYVVDSQKHFLEISVENWTDKSDHVYCLTLYFLNPKYHLKQYDRQLLFKHVSPYEEAYRLDIDECAEKQKLYIYRNYYRGADRGRTCCC